MLCFLLYRRKHTTKGMHACLHARTHMRSVCQIVAIAEELCIPRSVEHFAVSDSVATIVCAHGTITSSTLLDLQFTQAWFTHHKTARQTDRQRLTHRSSGI